jgi:hypothetical protein
MPVINGPLKITGNSIQVMRVVRGLSRRRLGELSGVKPWRIFQLEHHLVEPREAEVAKLLGALTSE